MEQFIGCDAHKKFSVFVAVNEKGTPARRCAWFMIGNFTASFWRGYQRILRSRWKRAVATVGW